MFLVTGATGGIGRRVVRLLREQETPVRAFVRLTSRYSELEHRGAEIFIGDLRREKIFRKLVREYSTLSVLMALILMLWHWTTVPILN